jgi:hypothetical protein
VGGGFGERRIGPDLRDAVPRDQLGAQVRRAVGDDGVQGRGAVGYGPRRPGSVAAMNLAPATPAGRHVRRERRRSGAAVTAAAAASLTLLVVAGPVAGAAGVVAGCCVLGGAVWRTFAAADADAHEERWLRTVLDRLDPDAADGMSA